MADGESKTRERKNSGFKQRFFDVKRRTTQTVLQKLGKAEATPDSEYTERKARVMALHALLVKANKHCQNYIDATRSLCFASAELGGDFKEFFRGGDSRVEAASNAFQSAMQEVDESVRKEMDDRVVADVMDPLKEKLAQFDELMKAMKVREGLKVDFDAYTRNVRQLKEKASKNAKKLGEKERKLQACRKKLEDATADLFWQFDTLEDNRTVMVLGEFRTFVESQMRFFQTSASLVGKTGEIPHVDAPAARERPTISFADADMGAAKAASAPEATAPAAAAAAAAPAAAAPAAAGGARCKALYKYVPQGDDELALEENDIIEILGKEEDGWWEGRIGGRTGVFPANYVQEL